MAVAAITTSPILALPEEKIFPDEALWMDKKIEWIKLSELPKDLVFFLTILLVILLFFSIAISCFGAAVQFPPAILIGGGVLYLDYKLIQSVRQRIPLAHNSSRARILQEMSRENILVEDLCKRVSISTVVDLWYNFTKEEKEQFQKALITQARINPLVFFDHFEVQYAQNHGYRKLVMVDGLYQILKSYIIEFGIEKEILNEIKKNIHLVPIHVLLLNYTKLKWMGLKLDKHPKLTTFLKEQEEKFSKLELAYRRAQEILEKLKTNNNYKRPKDEDLFLSIFTKSVVLPFSNALFVSNWQIMQKNCDQWLYRQLMAIEVDFTKQGKRDG